jgi:hypothetical protein
VIATIPHRFVTATNLDVEKINDNLEAGARAIQDNLDKRYTYSQLFFPVDGITDASAEVLRAFAIRRPGANNAVEVCGVEVVIYAAGSVTWTLACSDTTWPSITVTAAGATTEATASSGVPVSVPSSSSDLTFTLSAPAASTITRGYLIVHLRCDRGNQGTSHAGYTPSLLNSASSTAGSVLDTELAALASAVSRDLASQYDLRCECFSTRSLAAGSSIVFRLPSGQRTRMRIQGYVVAANTETVTFDQDSTSKAVTGTGVTSRATDGIAVSGGSNDDPMDSTDDSVITISNAGVASALLAYVLVWWS